ncbi:MAG TPA: hypothetical protein VMD30_13110 [Tepidisphaeraceae bacterium]|nr:hypothetical protein [Tepidisphaeraceae bacterium]
MRDFGEFLYLYFRTLISAITGGLLAAILMTWGAVAHGLPPFSIVCGGLAIYFFTSAYGIWKKERQNARQQQAKANADREAASRERDTAHVQHQNEVARLEQELRAMREALKAQIQKPSPDQSRYEKVREIFLSLPDWAREILRVMLQRGVMATHEVVSAVGGQSSQPIKEVNDKTGGWVFVKDGTCRVSDSVAATLRDVLGA